MYQNSMMFEKLKPFLYVIFLQFGNAGLVIIAKAALNHGMNQYTFATYRNLIATLVIAPFALFFERSSLFLFVNHSWSLIYICVWISDIVLMTGKEGQS